MITAIPEGLVIDVPYNRGFVNALKDRVPGLDRLWNTKKGPFLPKAPLDVWIIDPSYGDIVARLISQYYHYKTVTVPAVQYAGPVTVTRIWKVMYVGASKERDGGTVHSTGLVNDLWSLILPEDVLKNWFEGKPLDRQGGTGNTYFAVLGMPAPTEDQDEIKKAYRRIAKQWHPDVCHEPDATQVFQSIQEAYNVLSNPETLQMYMVGLKMAGHKQSAQISRGYNISRFGYRPPLRCGIVKTNGFFKLGRFIVQEILGWDDIVNSHGETLVTSYNINTKQVEEDWI